MYLLIQWLSSIGIPAFFRMAASAGLMTFLAIWLRVRDPFFRCCSVRGGDFGALVAAGWHDYVLPTPCLVGAARDTAFPVDGCGSFRVYGWREPGLRAI